MEAMTEQHGSIRQAFENAKALLGAGRRSAAIEQLQAILQAQPDEVNALLLLGSILSVERRFDEAYTLIRRAVDVAPDFHDAALELARVQRLRGDVVGAITTLEKLLKRKADLSRAWQLYGDSLYEAGRTKEGRQAFRRAAETDPHRPRIMAAINALTEGQRREAEQALREVLKVEPNHVHALVGLASLALDAGATEDAEHLLEYARRNSPYSDVVWRNIARLYSERADNASAELAARRAVELDPDAADAWSMLGNVQAWGLKPERARVSFETSLKLKDQQPRVWMSLGHVLKTLGESEGAQAAYKTAIRQQPDLGEAYWSLADLKTYRFSDDEIAEMRARTDGDIASEIDRAGFHFALAKALEDAKEFGTAFGHYASGNAIKARLDRFDSSGFHQTCRDTANVFDAGLLVQHTSPADAGQPIPIFIVGLPRSGSTLIEQILASHSQVEGTMELPHILNYVREMKSGRGYPAAARDMSGEELGALGQRYLDETSAYRSGAAHFIDKMPNNFLHVGLIACMLPQAIFIDARRDPRDACLSAFKQNFARGQTFSYSLQALGQYYRDYVWLMSHWDRVLPGRVLRVQYEDMVADTESQIRRVIDHCGLSFEDSCLRFYETKRAVRTASAEQVRQPIYARGVGHWKNFEPWLGALLEALGPELFSEDA